MLGLLTFLTACSLGAVNEGQHSSVTPILPVGSSASSFSSEAKITSSEGPLENADMDPAPTEQEKTTAESTFPERIVDNGLIEIGKADASVTLLMFTNHSCHYCSEFALSAFPRVQREYIDTGKIKYQIGILPLEKYPQAALQARSLLCAVKQGKGLAMHQLLFSISNSTEANMKAGAKALQLDEATFQACLADPAIDHLIQGQSDVAKKFDVALVPTFLLNDTKYVGLYEYSDLKVHIEEALKKAR